MPAGIGASGSRDRRKRTLERLNAVADMRFGKTWVPRMYIGDPCIDWPAISRGFVCRSPCARITGCPDRGARGERSSASIKTANIPSPRMSDTDIVFQPTVDDLVHAYRLNLWRRYNWKNLLRTFAIMSIVYVVLLFGGFRVASGALPEWRNVWWIAGIAAVVTIGVPLLYHLVMRRVARKIYSQQKTLHQPHTVIWRSECFIVESPTSHEEFRFADLVHWSEDRYVILLYQSAVMFRLIPKRALAASQVDLLRRTLLQNGVRKI
ncbi:YcxB family protein [Burkholderia contaminans]|nr:YcxB family protein [Burkholderia contaminans]